MSKQDRSHWMAEKTEKFSYDTEFKKCWTSALGIFPSIAGAAIQFIGPPHWINMIAATVCGIAAGLWIDSFITHYTNYRIIKVMGEAAEEAIAQHTCETPTIDEKELNELKKITGME